VKIIWSPLALERVSGIAACISQDNPSAAERWAGEVFSRVKQLLTLPESGRIVPEVGDPGIRELICGNYRIIYRIEARRISILTVRHGKQLLPVEDLNA
jgi:plasmid stabilization system protein ParE